MSAYQNVIAYASVVLYALIAIGGLLRATNHPPFDKRNHHSESLFFGSLSASFFVLCVSDLIRLIIGLNEAVLIYDLLAAPLYIVMIFFLYQDFWKTGRSFERNSDKPE